jgi:hypothetical protein
VKVYTGVFVIEQELIELIEPYGDNIVIPKVSDVEDVICVGGVFTLFILKLIILPTAIGVGLDKIINN